MPSLDDDITKNCDMDQEVKASGFLKEQLGKEIKNVTKLFDQIAQEHLDMKGEKIDGDDEDEESGDEEMSDGQGSKEEEKKGDDQEQDQIQENDKNGEGSDESESSDDKIEENPNRKVRFAETYEQRDTIEKTKENEEKELTEDKDQIPSREPRKPKENKDDQNEDSKDQLPEKKKKMKINQEFVREKVKEQLKNLANKNRQKRNNNKCKNSMITKNEIRETLADC